MSFNDYMKSNLKQLENRGYATGEKMADYKSLDDDEISALLKSENAVERTIAAKITGERRMPGSLPLLCELLKTEKKLYTKIAVCEAVEKYGTDSLLYLLPLVGKIGNNQHKKIDLVDLKKKSYPLPRDIAARIIARTGNAALPFLEDIIITGTSEQKSEIIDAIGHIAFNHNDYRSEKLLLKVFSTTGDELLKWKLIRAFQSFNSKEIRIILEKEMNGDNMILGEEAKRSLMQIEKRNAHNIT